MGPSFSSDTLYISSLCVQSHIEGKWLDSNHLVITTQFKHDSSSINTHALIHYSTTGYTFVDQEFAHNHEFPLYKLKKLCCLIWHRKHFKSNSCLMSSFCLKLTRESKSDSFKPTPTCKIANKGWIHLNMLTDP